MSRPSTPALDRIVAKLDRSGECWIWTGALNRGGYGVVRSDNGRARIAHRLVYELLVGDIPAGLDLDHLCRVRACCNPDHLEPVSRQINVDRGVYAAGRPRKMACVRGHEYSATNVKANGRGRACRRCANDANRRYRARLKEAA